MKIYRNPDKCMLTRGKKPGLVPEPQQLKSHHFFHHTPMGRCAIVDFFNFSIPD